MEANAFHGSYPTESTLMSIDAIFNKVKSIIGKEVPYQATRKQGGFVHDLIIKELGFMLIKATFKQHRKYTKSLKITSEGLSLWFI
ncbi:hypothetical protein MOO44_01290 (plasmid) [Nicoliella spurrieriana]|uniref:Uncharacterized protein n=1 Tax=Nicoliella spurrieriana TaxID=2925830 RepID=A0A976X4V6_9LACO|nr:hypothetical protein MOO44_01290 [Nicoliella spurrieriana]